MDHRARAEAYALRMPQTQFFSHSTAALFYGIPLPRAVERAQTIHVSARPAGGLPRAQGVRGHHEAWDREPVRRGELFLSSPVDTWCELWRELSIEELVAAGDYLVTGDEPYSGNPPLATLDELKNAVYSYGSRRGVRKLREALALVRYGSMSPMETTTRLFLVAHGLPEPELNHPVFDDDGALLALIDLAYPEYKVAIEYQSGLHMASPQHRNDIARRERLEDRGWTVIYISIDDIRHRPHETLARVRARLRARGALV